MFIYSWKIQLAGFYPDQFEDKGLLTIENAIEAFQLFPWDKEIEDYRRMDDQPNRPRIVFSCDDGRQLSIDAVNLKGFNFEYKNAAEHRYSDFYVSNDFNKKNFTAEEIIEFFFNHTLEKHIKLKEIHEQEEKVEKIHEKKSPKFTEFIYSPCHLKTFGIFPFVLMGFSVAFLVSKRLRELGIIFPVIISLSWLPVVILHLTYILKNRGARVLIDTRNNELTYTRGDEVITFSRDDIDYCQVTFASSSKSIVFDNYTYVWFKLKNQKSIVITCLVADPNKIVETLHCKFTEKGRSMPFLPF